MIMQYLSQCIMCARFDSKDRTKNACTSFPRGIPDAIFQNLRDHRLTLEGEPTWEPLPGAPMGPHPMGPVPVQPLD